MKLIVSVLLALSLIFTPIMAKAGDEPIKLEKGQTFVVPEAGWFFTIPQEKQIRLKLLEVDYLQQAYTLIEENNKKLEFQLNFQTQISDKYRTAWLETEDSLTDALKRESRSKFLYFLGGVLLTIGAGIAIGYSAKAIK